MPRETPHTDRLTSLFADDPDMTELLTEFCQDLGVHAQTLEAALDCDDLVRLRRVAHQLKGAGGGYGFPQITEAAAEVETSCDLFNGDLNEIRDRVDALVNLCTRANPA